MPSRKAVEPIGVIGAIGQIGTITKLPFIDLYPSSNPTQKSELANAGVENAIAK